MKEELYLFKDNLLQIIDSELQLSFQLPFAPAALPDNPRQGERLPSGHEVAAILSKSFVVEEIFLLLDKKRDGEARLLYPSGNICQKLFYNKGLLHGPTVFFSEEGEELVHSWFVEGKQEGKSCSYWPGGALRSLLLFAGGKQQGLQRYFYSDGTIKSEISFKSGLLEGTTILYDTKGKVKREITFAGGKRTS